MTNRRELGTNELNQVNGGFIFFKRNDNGTYKCAVYDESRGWKYLAQYDNSSLDEAYKWAEEYAQLHNVTTLFFGNPQAGNAILNFDDTPAEAYLEAATAIANAKNHC